MERFGITGTFGKRREFSGLRPDATYCLDSQTRPTPATETATMRPRYSATTSGRCTVTVEIDNGRLLCNITGVAEYTATDGEPCIPYLPDGSGQEGSEATIEFTDFEAIEAESCWKHESDDPDKWTYAERKEWGGGAAIYDRVALRHLSDDPEKYAESAFEDVAERNEDTRW